MGHFVEVQQLRDQYRISLLIASCVLIILSVFINKAFIIGFIISIICLVIALMMKLEVHIYDDRIEYRLSPFHKSSTIIFFDSVNSIDIIDSMQLGVMGVKIKSTARNRIYYFGGSKLIKIKSKSGKDIYLGTWMYKEIEKLLRR